MKIPDSTTLGSHRDSKLIKLRWWNNTVCISLHIKRERIFTDFFQNILGKKASTQDLIDLEEVYPNKVDLSFLSQPFSEEEILKALKLIPRDKTLEILKALKLIPRDKSLGPDGFGSGFYQDFYDLVKSDILNLFHQFYDERLQLDRNNHSYIVLIKKIEDSCSPNDYRPISLLNCLIKLITKALALILQGYLTSLIDLDQSGFIQSRCISDSFIYALEVIQTYKIRKKKTVILKLNFRKAFNTVS
jgi:hypothetical protein